VGRVKPAAAVLLLLLGGCALELRDRIESYVQGYEAIRLEKAVYVSTGGDDESPGTRESPKRSIQAGIDLAGALTGELGALEVRVAAGTYVVGDPVQLREKVSLRGGYDEAGWSRNAELNETVIAAQGAEKVIEAGAGITNATVIEGFTIRTAVESTVCGIYCSRGSPTVHDNRIDAGPGQEDSTAIFCVNASPLILGNTLDAGKGSVRCRGIVCQGSAAVIRNNVIFHQGGGANFRGILCNNAAGVLIQNNTIHGGEGSDGCLIYSAFSQCLLENNILVAAPQAACGFYEADTSSLPLGVRSNDFYNCDPLYRGADGPTSCASVTAMEAYLTARSVPAADNREEDPVFVDAAAHDYHLAGTSPLGDKGLNLSAFFSADRDGEPRTPPWSIGAYELDP
jgi:hypothetical protein